MQKRVLIVTVSFIILFLIIIGNTLYKFKKNIEYLKRIVYSLDGEVSDLKSEKESLNINLENKIEDLEYKIDTLESQIEDLEDKIF